MQEITLAGCRLNVLLHCEKQTCSGKDFVRFLLSTFECCWISASSLSRMVVLPFQPFFVTPKHLLEVSDVLAQEISSTLNFGVTAYWETYSLLKA